MPVFQKSLDQRSSDTEEKGNETRMQNWDLENVCLCPDLRSACVCGGVLPADPVFSSPSRWGMIFMDIRMPLPRAAIEQPVFLRTVTL